MKEQKKPWTFEINVDKTKIGQLIENNSKSDKKN